MDSAIKLAILGIIQGLTEFLPVSSSGHLAIAGKVFNFSQNPEESGFILVFTVLLHMATLLAVLVYFRKKIIHVYTSRRGLLLVVCMSIPTAIIGLALKKIVESMFASDLKFVYLALMVTGAILFAVSYKLSSSKESDSTDFSSITPLKNFWNNISPLKAILIGASQGIAVIPGISRSGITFTSGVYLNIPPREAAEFSFIGSIPAVAGAGLLMDVKDLVFSSSATNFSLNSLNIPMWGIFFSFGITFITGLIAIKIFLSSLDIRKGGRFRFFSYYLWSISIIGLISSVFL